MHRATNLTPSQLVLTVPPGTLSLPHAEPIDFEKLTPFLRKRRFHERLRNLMATSNKKLEAHQRKYKADFDKLVKERDVDLAPGHLAFLRRDAQSSNETDDNGRSIQFNDHKLRPKATGPYEIIKVDSHTVTILQDGLLQTVSRDRIVRAPNPPEPASEQEQTTGDGNVTDDAHPQPTNERIEDDEDPEATPLPLSQPTDAPNLEENPTTMREVNDEDSASSSDKTEEEQPAQPRRSKRLQSNSTETPKVRFSAPDPPTKDKPYAFDRLIDYDKESDLYRVRWTNYSPEDDTWESPSNVPYNAVRSLHHRKRWKLPEYKADRYLD